jgi:hypothetical protein
VNTRKKLKKGLIKILKKVLPKKDN